MPSSASWADAAAERPEPRRRRASVSCLAMGVARESRFCVPPTAVSFQFRFPLPSPPPGSRRSDGQGAAAMAQVSLVGEVTRALCAAGGALELEELRRRLRAGVGADALERLLREPRRFAVATRAAERVVLAVSLLRLCRAHQGAQAACAGLCAQLHLCKFMVYGACKVLKAG